MRIVYYRIYLLFLLASLAMLTHFSQQGEFRRLRTATKGRCPLESCEGLCPFGAVHGTAWGISHSAECDHGLRPLDSREGLCPFETCHL